MGKGVEVRVFVNILGREGEKMIDLEDGADSCSVIERVELFPDAVIVKRNGKVIPLDEPLSEGDRLTLILVASGG